jgi:hypothetical protein
MDSRAGLEIMTEIKIRYSYRESNSDPSARKGSQYSKPATISWCRLEIKRLITAGRLEAMCEEVSIWTHEAK